MCDHQQRTVTVFQPTVAGTAHYTVVAAAASFMYSLMKPRCQGKGRCCNTCSKIFNTPHSIHSEVQNCSGSPACYFGARPRHILDYQVIKCLNILGVSRDLLATDVHRSQVKCTGCVRPKLPTKGQQQFMHQ